MNRQAYKLIFTEWSLDLNITRLYVYSQPQKLIMSYDPVTITLALISVIYDPRGNEEAGSHIQYTL